MKTQRTNVLKSPFVFVSPFIGNVLGLPNKNLVYSRDSTMISKDYLPPNTPIVSNYIVVDDIAAFTLFLTSTFQGQIVSEQKDSQGSLVHANVRIENAILSVHQSQQAQDKTQTSLLIYVENVEAVIAQASEYGVTVKHQPSDNSAFEHTACIADSWGNLWWLASYVGK